MQLYYLFTHMLRLVRSVKSEFKWSHHYVVDTVARLTRKVSLEDCELIRILRHAITAFIEDVIPTNRTMWHALQSPGTFRDGDRSVLDAVSLCVLFNRLLLVIKCWENQYHIYFYVWFSDRLSYHALLSPLSLSSLLLWYHFSPHLDFERLSITLLVSAPTMFIKYYIYIISKNLIIFKSNIYFLLVLNSL